MSTRVYLSIRCRGRLPVLKPSSNFIEHTPSIFPLRHIGSYFDPRDEHFPYHPSPSPGPRSGICSNMVVKYLPARPEKEGPRDGQIACGITDPQAPKVVPARFNGIGRQGIKRVHDDPILNSLPLFLHRTQMLRPTYNPLREP
jgi:hypothetical protein